MAHGHVQTAIPPLDSGDFTAEPYFEQGVQDQALQCQAGITILFAQKAIGVRGTVTDFLEIENRMALGLVNHVLPALPDRALGCQRFNQLLPFKQVQRRRMESGSTHVFGEARIFLQHDHFSPGCHQADCRIQPDGAGPYNDDRLIPDSHCVFFASAVAPL